MNDGLTFACKDSP